MEKEEINIHEDMNNKTSKNSNGKNIIIVILLIIIAVLGTLVVVKTDKKVKNKKKKQEGKENKNEEKKEIEKPEEKKTEDSSNSVISDSNGTLKTDSKDSKEITINGNKYVISYTLVNDGQAGKHSIKLGDKELINLPAMNGIDKLKYNVFTASDNKQYLLVTYLQWGTYGYIYNESGKEVKSFNELAKITVSGSTQECFIGTKSNEELVSVKDGSVNYYRYKNGTVSGDDIKIEEVKITVSNDKVSESLTGNVKNGNYGQCA